jgi:hypothetical protein
MNNRRFTPDAAPARWGLGRLVPIVLLLWAIADLGFRFMPEPWFRIEPVQVATRLPGRYSPFVPNLKLRVDHSVGEQALLANLPPTETIPPLSFSTDELGFRVTPSETAGGSPQVIVFKGDSFTFGGSLSDEDTFASALTDQLGVGVYNGGKFFTDADGVKELDWLIHQLRPEHLTVVCVYLESHKRRFLSSFDTDLKKTSDRNGLFGRVGAKVLGARFVEYKDSILFRVRRYSAWWNISPLKIVCIRAHKTLYQGQLLPNESLHKIEVHRLPNNAPILLDPDKVRNLSAPEDEKLMKRTADYMAWMRDYFAARNVDFWVLLLPDKESVYSTQILNAPEPEAGKDNAYLDRLAGELARHHVRNVNALTVLQRTASEDWSTGNLSYYREDHHWNPRGVARVAGAMAEALRRDGWSPAVGDQDLASRIEGDKQNKH